MKFKRQVTKAKWKQRERLVFLHITQFLIEVLKVKTLASSSSSAHIIFNQPYDSILTMNQINLDSCISLNPNMLDECSPSKLEQGRP